VQSALSAINDQCDGLDRNSACYGFQRVEALFTETVAEDFFSQPSDRSDLLTLAEITTAPYNLDLTEWGVAVLNLQADLPDTLPGQAVVFVLLGDVEVENAVDAATAAQPTTPLTITTTTTLNVRSRPSENANRIGIAQNRQTLSTDGVDSSGVWLRVAYGNGYGWVKREFVTSSADLSTLPIISAERRTPMQAFYLRTGIGQPACAEAPQDTLLIQSPQDLKIRLNVNGAEIEVGSTIALRTREDGANAVMEIIVLDGQVQVLPDEFSRNGLTIKQGQQAEVCLTPEQDLGTDGLSDDRLVGCAWSTPQWADVTEFCALAGIVLEYPIRVPCGENSSPPAAPTATPATSIERTPPPIDCTTLQRLETTSRWFSRLEWTPAAGADEYKVNVYNAQGDFATAHSLNSNSGAYWTLDVRAFNLRAGFQWEVEARRQGVTYCTTSRSVVYGTPTEPEPTPEPPLSVVVITPPPCGTCGPTFTANLVSCVILPLSGLQQATISWSNANLGDNITITTIDNLGFNYVRMGSGVNGSVIINSLGITHRFDANPFLLTTTSGLNASVPPCP
jgi:hypothetical protein